MNDVASDLGMFGTGSCSCDFNGDCPPEVYNKTFRKARKEHRCTECGDWIKKGERYEHVAACYEGSWNEYKTCLPCVGIANDLGCRLHDGLVEQFQEIFGWDYRDDPATWDDDEEDT